MSAIHRRSPRGRRARRWSLVRAAAWLTPFAVLWIIVAGFAWRVSLWSGCKGLCGFAEGWASYTLINAAVSLTALVGAIELAALLALQHWRVDVPPDALLRGAHSKPGASKG
ncbi:MAG TPA: hypothetical protein VF221_05590 [Chloroflexota bacterium]